MGLHDSLSHLLLKAALGCIIDRTSILALSCLHDLFFVAFTLVC